jgi:hypothetical protein
MNDLGFTVFKNKSYNFSTIWLRLKRAISYNFERISWNVNLRMFASSSFYFMISFHKNLTLFELTQSLNFLVVFEEITAKP